MSLQIRSCQSPGIYYTFQKDRLSNNSDDAFRRKVAVMNSHIILGLFALYVGIMSLLLVLSGREDALLARLRSLWGRTCGHAIYFAGHVALPLLVCVVCLGWGVRHYNPSLAGTYAHPPLRLNLEAYRNLERQLIERFDAEIPAINIAA